MRTSTAPEHYSRISVVLHWLMLLVISAAYATIELRESYPRGSDPREALKAWHFTLGLTVFALVWLRIAARLIWPAPPPSAASPRWTQLTASATHFALYALMIALPLAGWIVLSAEGDPVPFYGLELPALTGPNKALAEQVEGLHELGGTIGYWLIGLHAVAALFHQYVLKDRLLERMSLRA